MTCSAIESFLSSRVLMVLNDDFDFLFFLFIFFPTLLSWLVILIGYFHLIQRRKKD
jgi:hypothetical protein